MSPLRNPLASRGKSLAAAAVLSALGCLAAPHNAGAATCTSGADVRNLVESGVPQSLKDKIFKSPGPIIAMGSSAFPSGKLVVIRAAAQDFPQSSAATSAYVGRIFFGTNDPAKKSIRGYFARNSYGKFQVVKGAVPPWLTLGKKLTAYTPGVEGNATYLRDVLKKADVKWSALDTNHDHSLAVAQAQIVILIPNALPGTGFASTRSVTAGSVQTPHGTFDFPARSIVIFSLKATADPQFADNPIRALAAVAHELCHAFFNLPDRYGANTGTGEYDMMGSSNSSTWVLLPMHDRVKIGWIKPKIIRTHLGKCLQFVVSELQDAALILVPGDPFLTHPLEYWVIENRNNDKPFDYEGYDSDLPDDGLAVWYVSTGTYSSGHDDVRLVDFSKPDEDPDSYNNPGSDAFFKRSTGNPKRLLLNRKGQWSLLYFQRVSDVAGGIPGLFMFGEF